MPTKQTTIKQNVNENYILILVSENHIYHMEQSSNYAELLDAAFELALDHIEREDKENLEKWKTSFNQLKSQWETTSYDDSDKNNDIAVSYIADLRDFNFWSRVNDTLDIYIKPLDRKPLNW